jgi:hypothetical protein
LPDPHCGAVDPFDIFFFRSPTGELPEAAFLYIGIALGASFALVYSLAFFSPAWGPVQEKNGEPRWLPFPES